MFFVCAKGSAPGWPEHLVGLVKLCHYVGGGGEGDNMR